MYSNTTTHLNAARAAFGTHPPTADAVQLTESDCEEALDFLSRRPDHTVILAGWILDHGIVSPKHRGTFYGCRNEDGDLAGVAMIGRNLLFEANTEDAVIAFATCARECPDIRMIFAEEEKLKTFWRWFRPEAVLPEPTRHQLAKSGSSVANGIDDENDLRIATLDDLDQIVSAHAEMVFAETGIDPLVTDAEGFRTRCAGRVEKGRVWAWMIGGELIFKTDIVSHTREAIYAEGLWVNSKYRNNGYGTRGLTSLCRKLLTGSNSICVFLDADHSHSKALYRKVGFTVVHEYVKIFV